MAHTTYIQECGGIVGNSACIVLQRKVRRDVAFWTLKICVAKVGLVELDNERRRGCLREATLLWEVRVLLGTSGNDRERADLFRI
jgi:hypothetical protein